MKKTATAIVVLAAVSAASFWFGQRSGMEDFARCLESGGVPVGDSSAGKVAAGGSFKVEAGAVVGEWRNATDESLVRVFSADGKYHDVYNGQAFDEFGEWKISGQNVLLSAGSERQAYAAVSESNGGFALELVGGESGEKFIR